MTSDPNKLIETDDFDEVLDSIERDYKQLEDALEISHSTMMRQQKQLEGQQQLIEALCVEQAMLRRMASTSTVAGDTGDSGGDDGRSPLQANADGNPASETWQTLAKMYGLSVDGPRPTTDGIGTAGAEHEPSDGSSPSSTGTTGDAEVGRCNSPRGKSAAEPIASNGRQVPAGSLLPSPPRPCHPHDMAKARVRLMSLREVANMSARATISAHVKKRFWENAILKLVLIVQSVLTAMAFWNNGLFGFARNPVIGWAAAAIGAVTLVELIRSTIMIHDSSPFRRKRPRGKAHSRRKR